MNKNDFTTIMVFFLLHEIVVIGQHIPSADFFIIINVENMEVDIMATMNSTKKSAERKVSKDTKTTKNHHGITVHKLDALETLFSRVLGSLFGESTHYEKRTAEGDYQKLCDTIKEVHDDDIEYVLKIARLGREYNMIQYPLSVLTACMNDDRFKGEDFIDEKTGKNKLHTYSYYIIRRGKDILDILATQMSVYGFATKGRGKNKHRETPIPMQMRKVLRGKIESFNEYQLSKALGESKQISMADAIKLLHPNPSKSRVGKDFYKDIIEGKVKMGADQAQVQSEIAKVNNKNSKTTKKDVVKSIDTSTVMAIVKNLVALEKQGLFNDKTAVDSIVAKLTDKKEVQKSRLLPFRFYSAYKEVSKLPSSEGKRRVLDALVEALDLSIDNLPDIAGYSAILIDMSGSMGGSISSMSSVTAKELACVLGAICFKKGIADVYLFANDCKRMDNISKKSTVMDITDKLLRTNVGGATYLDTALNTIRNSGAKYTNLIILSDGDCYSTTTTGFRFHCWSRYSTDDNVNDLIKEGVIKKAYVNNLLGNNFAIVNTDDYRKNLITGFSERIVDVINTYSAIGTDASDIRVVIDGLMESFEK